MRKVVVFSGSGISAESGIPTYRGEDGTWDSVDIETVATPGAWRKDRSRVLDFHNRLRRTVLAAEPNPAHLALKQLETKYRVTIVTQNVDDLHERAGSSNVIHLHGEIRRSMSTAYPPETYPIEGPDLNIGDRCPRGSQLRPAVVWFGEPIPAIKRTLEEVNSANVLIIVGTSLQVYPAASLVHHTRRDCELHLVDPNDVEGLPQGVSHTKEVASIGIPDLVKRLLK